MKSKINLFSCFLDAQLAPEEEERRRVRRERNKLAAARCRKRRVDHTNSLMNETEGLEETKHLLQKQLQTLRQEAEELQFLLHTHSCRHIQPNFG